jgi:hypothetical protein
MVRSLSGQAWDTGKKRLMIGLGDYDKVGAQYKRSFLWTGPLYYAAVQYGLLLLARRKLEKIAGSFDMVERKANTRAAMVRVRT